MRNFAINNFQKLSDLVTHTGSDLRRNSPWRRWRKKFILDVKGLQNNLVTGLVPNWRRQFFLNQLLDTKFLFLLQKNVRLFILFESISEYQHLPQMTFIRRSFLTNYFALSSSFLLFLIEYNNRININIIIRTDVTLYFTFVLQDVKDYLQKKNFKDKIVNIDS